MSSGNVDFKKIVFDLFPFEFERIPRAQKITGIPEGYMEILSNIDFAFFHKPSSEIFWVECRYVDALTRDKIQWGDKSDFMDYHLLSGSEYGSNIYMAIGFGGSQYNPKHFYWIPLSDAGYTGLYPSSIRQYERSSVRSISYEAEEELLV
jgi:hypothetical protein